MRLRICAIGRMKAGAEKILADDYLNRSRALGKQVGLTGIDVSDAAETVHDQPHVRIARDAETLHGLYPEGTLAVALDGRGKPYSTEEFTQYLRRQIDSGTSQLVFLIGGPDGHAEQTLKAAALVLSLGPMTWPHRLVRVMLAEQIYRAVTIMVNHPYHRP